MGNCMVNNGAQAVRMPGDETKWMKFENYHKQLEVPFVMYADFESIVVPTVELFLSPPKVSEKEHDSTKSIKAVDLY